MAILAPSTQLLGGIGLPYPLPYSYAYDILYIEKLNDVEMTSLGGFKANE